MGMEESMFANHFQGDTYETASYRRRFLLDSILLGCRWTFYLKYLYVCYKAGKAALQGRLGVDGQIAHSYQTLLVAEGCGAKISIKGMDNIDKADGPAVLIGNHMSMLETAVMVAFISPRKPAIFVVKAALFDIPFYGHIMRAMGNIGVARSNPREDLKKVISEGKKRLEAGKSIILYPQSTRSAEFNPKRFNSIGVKLAKEAKVSIIPFALKTDFLANGKWAKDLGPIQRNKKVYFEFGEPIKVRGHGKEEHQKIIEFIQDRLKKWNSLPDTF
jgi:1-acyl-sn-glycerol-3-phosphate acyltransferase